LSGVERCSAGADVGDDATKQLHRPLSDLIDGDASTAAGGRRAAAKSSTNLDGRPSNRLDGTGVFACCRDGAEFGANTTLDSIGSTGYIPVQACARTTTA